jgi:predicted O-methyltransferase YrrM
MRRELYAYLDSVNDRESIALRQLRMETAGDPDCEMALSPMAGQFLAAMTRMTGALKICEVGVYTGYSTLAMALAVPEAAHIWAFDRHEGWTAIARKHWSNAGVAGKITLWLDRADASMRRLIDEGHGGTFDLIFIDANKDEYRTYWDLAHRLLRLGGVVIADNTLFQGALSSEWTDERLAEKWSDQPPDVRAHLIGLVHAIRAFNHYVHRDERFAISMLPVGDGMTLGVRLS